MIGGRAGNSAFRKSFDTLWRDPIGFGRSVMKRERSEAGAWALGGLGEFVMARRLAKLPTSEWLILHDMKNGPSDRNIDHLVIGPAGVFVINTKLRNGFVKVTSSKVYVNGFPTKILAAVRFEARDAGLRLGLAAGGPLQVTPVLAFLCDDARVESDPEGVLVGRAGDFPRILLEPPQRFTKADLAPVARAASADMTWTREIPSTPVDESSKLVIKRWARYGKKRLYVTLDGTEVGYIDLLTGEISPQREVLREILEEVARQNR